MFNDLLASSATLLAAATPEASQPNTWVLDRIDILLGFILGLAGTGIIGLVQSSNKKRRFCVVASSELKRLLCILLNSCVLHKDSEIDEKKVKFCFESERKYKLADVLLPEGDRYVDDGFRRAVKAIQKGGIDETLIAGFVRTHNIKTNERKSGQLLASLHNVACRFIKDNLEIIGSLRQDQIERFLCILDRVSTLNFHIDSLSQSFNATFDSTLSPENYERIKMNYYGTCQIVSDFAYATSMEIDGLLDIL